MRKVYTILPLVLLWAALTLAAWFTPPESVSLWERRQLAQFPEIRWNTLASGDFMADFEDYTLDQFPLRDAFRSVKSLFHTAVLGQKDTNGIYLHGGYAAEQVYPLNEASVRHVTQRLEYVYEKYLKDSRVFLAVTPDKGYYLAEEAGQLSLDYSQLLSQLEQGLPWAVPVDLTGTLTLEDYYRTDTHWRQERLLETAQALCRALGVTEPKAADYTQTTLERTFYGVYYGQAALPMKPDTMTLMESGLLDECTVYDYETGETGAVYNLDKLDSPDLYDVYLSGAKSLLTIENPNAKTDRELLIFRDSFGSSLAPLLVSDYARVTLIDLRYIHPDLLEEYISFQGQDVLLLYSTLVLNDGASIR